MHLHMHMRMDMLRVFWPASRGPALNPALYNTVVTLWMRSPSKFEKARTRNVVRTWYLLAVPRSHYYHTTHAGCEGVQSLRGVGHYRALGDQPDNAAGRCGKHWRRGTSG